MRKTVLTLIGICAFSVLHAQPPGVAGQHQNRAASLLLSHDFESAIAELRQAAAQYKAAASWPYYFSCLNQITQAQLELGQLDAAKQTAKQALWQSIETLSRNNDEAAKAAHKLGQVYEAAGRFEDAMECHRMAYDIREDLFSREHPQTAASLLFMAVTARKQQAFEGAASLLEEAEAVLTEYYEAGHPELSQVWEERGMLYEKQEQLPKAREAYEQAIAILKVFPNQYPEALGRNWCRLARLLPEGERAQAYQRAYHLFEANERMQNSFAGEAALELSRDALQAGQPALAVQIAERAKRNPEARSSTHPLLAKSYLLLGQLEPALQQFRHWINSAPDALQPTDWSNAAELALLSEADEEALRWSKLFEERSESLLPRYFAARAYAASGNETRARQILNHIIRSPEPATLKALAEEALGELELQNGDTEQAMAHFKSALRQAGRHEFSQIRLLYALGQAHTLLAGQDRHAIDNIIAGTDYYAELQDRLGHLVSKPLTPFEAHWLKNHLEGIVNSGMQHLYLQQQYVRKDFSVEGAYHWFEFAKVALFDFHDVEASTAPAFWKYRSHRLENAYPYEADGASGASSAVAEVWAGHRSKEAAQVRYAVEQKPLQEFETVLAALNLRSYHYWIAGQDLYVLQLGAGAGRLYRKTIEPEQNGQIRSLSGQTLFPGLEASDAAGISGILVLPSHQLAMYPFSRIAFGEGTVADTYVLYRHLCAASFLGDLSTAGQLPGAEADAYFFQKEPSEKNSDTVVAVPTSHSSIHNCFAVLSGWLSTSRALMKLPAPYEAVNARLLLTADAGSALALARSGLPRTRYFALDEAYTDYWGNSTTGLINRVRAQQQFIGAFIEQQGLCQDPEVYVDWLEAAASSPNPMEQLAALQAQPEYKVLQTVRTFGAPYSQSGKRSGGASDIPVLWILGGVFGLILTGLWVRR